MAIALVQKADTYFANGSPATSEPQAFGSAVATGSLLVAVCSWINAGVTCSVADSINGAYTAGPAMVSSGNNLQLFYFPNSAAGADTVTFSFSGAGAIFIHVAVLEYSGVKTTSPSDGSHEGTGSSGTAPDSGPLTTTGASDLLFGYANASSGRTWAAQANFTKETTATTPTMIVEDRLNQAAQTWNATPNGGVLDYNWCCGAFAFLVAPAMAAAAGLFDLDLTYRNTLS